MTKLITTTAFRQNTVAEYSGNVAYEIFSDKRIEYILFTYPFSGRKSFGVLADSSYRYREFTFRVFKNSNVLNTAWQTFLIPRLSPYVPTEYITGSSDDNDNLRQIAENIIIQLASHKSAWKIMSGIFKKDPRLYYHSIEVMCLSMSIARRLGYSKEEVHDIGMAAVLHDVSKVLLPYELLHLTRKPTDIQKKKLEKIPDFSAAMVKKANLHTPDILKAVMSHQENYIGTGYPHGKMQREIHPYSMMIHVADDYDMMSIQKGSEYARNYIKKMVCRRYSFSAVNAFNDLYQ